ncbi:MAG: rhodanese-like domain-containing protein [Desulfuromonadales bacterium]
MKKMGYKDLVAGAEEEIDTLSVEKALKLLGTEEVVFVDLRDIRELRREGKIPGARHVPRGMLEFWIDPESPYHKPLFTERKRFVFYCKPPASWMYGADLNITPAIFPEPSISHSLRSFCGCPLCRRISRPRWC